MMPENKKLRLLPTGLLPTCATQPLLPKALPSTSKKGLLTTVFTKGNCATNPIFAPLKQVYEIL
ncbi:MAG: hypothetical protein EAZ16_08410 [Sphingobacteriales bacterium]|nr:MAG: hypothetical protein EAZ16_08410 [Sphingobacteriales bacterium]